MIKSNYYTIILLVTIAISPHVYAARPSINSLQQQINELQAETSKLQSQIDAIPKIARFVDANDVVIGDTQSYVDPSEARVLFQVGANIYYAHLTDESDGVIDFDGALYYDGANCTGNPYAWPVRQDQNPGSEELRHLGKDGIFYTADTNAQPRDFVGPLYYWGHGDCRLDSGNVAGIYPAVPFLDISGLKRPFQLKIIPAP